MLNKITIAALALTITTTAANAEWREYHHHHYNGGGGGGNNWMAPLVGGLIIGGIISNMNQPRYHQQQPEYDYVPVCRDYVEGYDFWGRPVIRRICQ
jgi:hypothetical protein